jgi:hypothetical protein
MIILKEVLHMLKISKPQALLKLTKPEALLKIKDVEDCWLSEFSDRGIYGKILKEAFLFCKNGNNVNNHYHNLFHIYTVLDLCYYYINKYTPQHLGDDDSRELTSLAIAALFHDYDHSGLSIKEVKDKVNIDNAIKGLYSFKKHLVDINYCNFCTFHLIFELAERAIRTTRVIISGNMLRFPVEPKRYIECILRDADVSGHATALGRYNLKGLAKEQGVQYDKKYKEQSINFFKNIHLFTKEAKDTREEFLTTYDL